MEVVQFLQVKYYHITSTDKKVHKIIPIIPLSLSDYYQKIWWNEENENTHKRSVRMCEKE